VKYNGKKVKKTIIADHRENMCRNLVVHHLEGEWTLSIGIDLCKNFGTNETHKNLSIASKLTYPSL